MAFYKFPIEVLTSILICVATFNCYVQSEAQTCDRYQFQCADEQCIWKWGRCDSINHCDDHSDELNCSNVTCRSYEFRCTSGQCIPADQRCNSANDCVDHSDELNCTNALCRTNEFKCPSEHCLRVTFACEYRCTHNPLLMDSSNFTCGASDNFSCQDGYCARPELKCMTGRACERNKVLRNCSSSTCQFHCDSDGHCKSMNNKCDFVHNCPATLDEVDCGGNQLCITSLQSRYHFLLSPSWALNDKAKGYGPSFMHTNLKNSNVSKNQGEDLELICQVYGFPKPIIDWTWENKDTSRWPKSVVYTLSNDNTTLLVRDISSIVRGRITCTAQNGNGKISENVDISVVVKDASAAGSFQSNKVLMTVYIMGSILFILVL